MKSLRTLRALALASCCLAAADVAAGPQDSLTPIVNAGDENVLRFDWPMLQIGTGEYAEGPTGVTVIRFGRKVFGAVDVRGGGPGTVNTDFLRLGYETPDLDAVVFAGGSWYGLEATTAVASALKDDGVRDGHWDNLALAVGAIIYDLGPRRLNEIYPDKKLAQAALRAARPGVFPLGAQGAGRFAWTGGLFGCNAQSGQGAAYRQVGDVKIAVFTVVNALGVVTTRDGRIAACYADPAWPKDLRATTLLSNMPDSRKAGWSGSDQPKRNTTVSLVVTNQKLDSASLQRLAVQVHTSMARALQPFATQFDGDVLYAVSTAELDDPKKVMAPVDLGVAAGELMWDAILRSVPEQPKAIAAQPGRKRDGLDALAGEYSFSPFASLRVSAENGKLYAQASGARDVFAITRKDRVELQPTAGAEFTVPGRYPLVLRFDGDTLTINPGHWAQTAQRKKDR